MCSPVYLREHYWPHAKYSLEPFVEAGIRLICHCDGNVMPLVDDFVGAGFSGFQGFQYECGVDPYLLAGKRSLRGEEPLFLFTSNVTGVEVPPANLRAAYRYLESVKPGAKRRGSAPRPWPWAVAYPDGRIPMRRNLGICVRCDCSVWPHQG